VIIEQIVQVLCAYGTILDEKITRSVNQ